MKTRIGKSESGISITELTVVVAVFSMLGAMVLSTVQFHGRTFRQQAAQSVTQSGMRIWLLRMVKDIRRCGNDPRDAGLFGIIEFEPERFRCTTDADADGLVDGTARESIGYAYENGTIYSWQGGTTWRPLLTGVGGLRFVYRDVRGDVVTGSARAVSTVEVGMAAEASDASYLGRTVTTAAAPVFHVGDFATTVAPDGGNGLATFAQVERATLRNWK